MADVDMKEVAEEAVPQVSKSKEVSKESSEPEETKKESVAEEKEASVEAEEANGKDDAEEDDEEESTQPQEDEEEYVLKDETTEDDPDGDDEKSSSKDSKKDADTNGTLGTAVAKHYNEIPEGTKETRKESRIFYLRNFNNWIKSVLISDFLGKIKRKRRRYDDDINVLDLGCGKGGDLLKWQKGNISHVICADIADTSVQQCRARYEGIRRSQQRNRYGGYGGGYNRGRDGGRLFSIEYLAADCTKVKISDKYRRPHMKVDLTSCQFAFHYSFESLEQAEMMLQNACEQLRPGGYFIGTTPDANKLVKRIKEAEGNSFGNDVYNIEFDDKESFPIFGSKYHFKLEGVVDCPEFLVYMSALEKLTEKYNMRLVYAKSFHEIFEERKKDFGYLLQRMNALEAYPAKDDHNLLCEEESQYSHAKESVDKAEAAKDKIVGTLTKDEWEVAGLYLAFGFEKIDPKEEQRKEEERKRREAEEIKREEERKKREEERKKREEEREKREAERKVEAEKKEAEKKEAEKKEAEKKEAEKKEAAEKKETEKKAEGSKKRKASTEEKKDDESSEKKAKEDETDGDKEEAKEEEKTEEASAEAEDDKSSDVDEGMEQDGEEEAEVEEAEEAEEEMEDE